MDLISTEQNISTCLSKKYLPGIPETYTTTTGFMILLHQDQGHWQSINEV